MKKMTALKLALLLAMLSAAVISFNTVRALTMCQGWVTASYGGGSKGSATGQCYYSYSPIPNSKVIVEMRDCASNAVITGTPKTTFCTGTTSCSGTSNSFTRASGHTYYSFATYTPDRNYPSWAFYDTSACR
jgi:hypothetical protein